jgi:hypothetical protein
MDTKYFDYAITRDGKDVEVRFIDGSRLDVPLAEWRAIVNAGHDGLLTHAQNDEDGLT